MFKTLLGVKLRAFLYRMSGGARRKRSKATPLLFAFLMLYFVGVFTFLFASFFRQVIMPFHNMGVDWLYFGLMGIMAFAMMFMFSIFTTGAQLYEAKDNELLLSLPIPTGYILGSRLVALLIEDYFYELIVVVPAIIVWCGKFQTDVMWWISIILITIFLPFFAIALTGILSYIINRIVSRARNKTAVTVLLTLAILAVYFFLYNRANYYIQLLIENGEAVSRSLYDAARPVYWLGAAVAEGDIVCLLLTLAMCILAFALIYTVVSLTFIKTTTARRGFTAKKYKKKQLNESSQMSALIRKEFSRIGSSAVYIMNAGMGVLCLLAVPVLLIIYRGRILGEISDILSNVPVFSTLLLCFAAFTITFSVPSVSLEGRSIWIPLSMPVRSARVLYAKALTHLYIALPPMVLATVVTAIVFEMDLLLAIITLVTTAAFTVFNAVLGVVVNLRHPRLDWISEVQVIKQSMSLLISMGISFAAVFTPALLYLIVFYERVSSIVFLAGYALLLIIADVLMFKYLSGAGAKRFEEIVS